MKVIADSTLHRVGDNAWLGGSPLRLFRLSDRGDTVLADLVHSGAWSPSTTAEGSLCDRLADAGAVHPEPTASEHWDSRTVRDELTVVIPVRDDTGGLATLLGELRGDRLTREVRIVVVDDGSENPVDPTLVAHAHGATVRRHDRPRGPAAARNTGLGDVQTPLVAFIDADVRTPTGWLEPLLAHLGDPRTVAVAPRVCTGRQGVTRHAGEGDPGTRGSSVILDALMAYEAEHGALDMGGEPARVAVLSRVSYVPTATIVVRSEAVRSIGGFDERLRFGEDVDLVWRLVESGGIVRYEPSALVAHRPRGDLRKWLAQRVDYGSSAAELDRRHPGAAAPAAASPWSTAVWIAALSGHPLLGAVITTGSAVALVRKLTGVEPRRAVELAMQGHLGASRQLTRALIRPWWPATIAVAAVSRRARRVAIAAVLVHLGSTPGRASTRLFALMDDVAYSAGVWRGAMRARNPRVLIPVFPRWP